jgi:tRNA (guanine-N7-)-methyltransferase
VTRSRRQDFHQTIRSYVIRSGRLTTSQRNAIDQHWADYVIEYRDAPLRMEDLFAAGSCLHVEIGFGMGDSLLQLAMQEPANNYIGIEVHKPGVGKLLHGIAEHQLTNLRIICHDARAVLQNCFDANSIDKLLVLFPDPWPKKRHHKRRLLQAEFAELAASRLKAGGCIHLATDWQAYAEHMMTVLENTRSLENTEGSNCYWDNPVRPATKFERRGQILGHGVWDLNFRKRLPGPL